MHKALLAVLLAATATAGQASVTITFDTPANTNPGTSATFGPLTAKGYVCPNSGCTSPSVSTDLYIKDLGAGEQGLGINSDPTGQHEIYSVPLNQSAFFPFVQLDVSALLGITNSASFVMDSTTADENWDVYGSNIDGVPLDELLQGNDELSHDFSNWGAYKYYDFFSIGTVEGSPSTGFTVTFGNVLLHSLTYTPSVPEPGTWAMMLLGFGAMGIAFRRRRTSATMPQIA